jgi:putative permease
MRVDNPILQAIASWFKRNFSNPEALSLFFTLIIGFVLIEFFGEILLPVFISIAIAYLLSSPVRYLERWRLPHGLAVIIVFAAFLGVFLFALFGLLPLLWKQLVSMIHELPSAFVKGQAWATELMQHYPKLFPDNPLSHAAVYLHQQAAKIGQFILSYSLASIHSIIQTVLYVVLVPLLVFFFLKDGKKIATWLSRFLPHRRGLVQTVWLEVNDKIGAYVRGRVVEVIVVAIITVIVFSLLKLQYAVLLGALVGVSVIVPYIGAIIVTIPVLITSLMQWGFSPHAIYLMIAYGIIITLDGNILVPLLFSETMDLHPLVIILSVLVFGGIWGFWGVFFAIPLATLIKAVLDAWPRASLSAEEVTVKVVADKSDKDTQQPEANLEK